MRPLQRLPRAPRRALGADRRRRRRRPAAAAASCSRTRSSATARSASSTTTRASRASRAEVLGTTFDLPEVLEDVEPDEVLIAIPSASGRAARARRQRLPRARRAGAHDADGLRAAARAAATLTRQLREVQRRGRARPRAGEDGDRARRRLSDRPQRARHRRGRVDRLRALPPDRAREPQRASCWSITARRTCSRSSASSSSERHVLCAVSVLADCKDDERMREVFAEHRPEVVFHAAAYKHVALMEANPIEAVRNNALATRSLTGDRGRGGRARVRADLDRQGGRARDRHGRVEGARRVGRGGGATRATRRRRSAPCASATCSAPRARWCRSSGARSPRAARSR